MKPTESLNDLDESIITFAREYEKIEKKLEMAEEEKFRKQEELFSLRETLNQKKSERDILQAKNTAIRDQSSEFEQDLKQQREAALRNKKLLFKQLGMKVSVKEGEKPHYIELLLRFVENLEHSVTLVYDIETQDYCLIAMQPVHPKFNELRAMLNATKDIQGFLCGFRRLVINKSKKD